MVATKKKGRNDTMSEKKTVNNIQQSFIIEVKSRENHTWQGTVSWVEGKKKENFRSALEMLKLIDSTLEH